MSDLRSYRTMFQVVNLGGRRSQWMTEAGDEGKKGKKEKIARK